jgi:hypothetical protein
VNTEYNPYWDYVQRRLDTTDVEVGGGSFGETVQELGLALDRGAPYSEEQELRIPMHAYTYKITPNKVRVKGRSFALLKCLLTHLKKADIPPQEHHRVNWFIRAISDLIDEYDEEFDTHIGFKIIFHPAEFVEVTATGHLKNWVVKNTFFF